MTTTANRVSANYWPGLDELPSGPQAAIATRVARRLFRAAVSRLDVSVVIGDETLGRGGPVAVVHRPDEFFARIGRDQLIGFGEAYLTGAWDAEDLGGFLTVLCSEIQHLVPRNLQKLRSLVVARPPRWQKSNAKNAQGNIAHHYDLSNDLFELFLDPTLSYSSALFDDPATATRDGLEHAQGRKIERLLDQAGVVEGTRLLEIGSGWGELAIRAARRGATVRTITLSVEQKVLAEQRIAAAGCTDLVDRRALRLPRRDRHLRRRGVRRDDRGGRLAVLEDLLRDHRPGARPRWPRRHPGDHHAGRPDARDEAHLHLDQQVHLPRRVPALGRGHRRPHLPAHQPPADRPPLDGRALRGHAGLWDEAFLGHSERVLALGFDETFLRMWHFYLEYSRAGFASGYIDVNQLTFTKSGVRR